MTSAQDVSSILSLARAIRVHVLRMTHRAKSSHVGTCLSMAEILAALYARVLRVNPQRADWPERDRFVLSKGHGCAALYAVLAECGFFPASWLETFYMDGSKLWGHATHHGIPGVEVSTGSLGHGLGIACGMALASLRDGAPWRVFTVLSDGECDEGYQIQSLGSVKDVLGLEPLAEKWRAFGWAVREVDGNSVEQLLDVLQKVPFERGRPSCIVGHTVKGKGVSFMEGNLLWHYRSPNEEELASALTELLAEK